MQHDHTQHRVHPRWKGKTADGGYFEGRGSSEGKGNKASTDKGKPKLHAQAVLLLVVSGLFGVANALSGTFVGVYLWKAKSDLALLGWFALATNIAVAVTFWLAGKWVKEYNKMNCLRLGVLLSASFYMLVLWLGKHAVDYVIWLGIVQGIASGFFWLAFNVVYFEVTDPDNRDRFNGWSGLLGSGAGIVAPWISGILIVRMAGANGYRLIFSISLGIFLLGILVSFFLKKRKVAGSYEWLLPWRCVKQEGTPWRSVSAALVAQGFREGVFGFMIGLMVYITTASEARLGSFVLITSAVSLFSFWLTGKYMKPAYRSRAMLIGSLAMTALILPFFWKVNFVTLLIFGIGISLFIPLFSIPILSAVFDLIGGNARSASQREEYIVLRELALNIGRILSVLLFIAVVSWSTTPLIINSLLLLVGSSMIISWWFMRKQLAANLQQGPLDKPTIPATISGNDCGEKRE
ncbi:MFS transporter [Paenibacillus eucommiae]|uniref:YQGE family putative transporter n=1 Tax=Paenibacillus eucommiae TaxID=1355755 RepID=A0ABS4J103_9BACL|nr:MFS transporter [Paenibacillus eucommiae]MBP1993514.1 YQGE family putative transporter [Paenibacillus eucommiae]